MEECMNAVMKQDQAVETKNPNPASYLIPPVDIEETKDAYLLVAEMPGVGKDGLEILLDRNELTILGRRTVSAEGAEWLYRESKAADFRRVFELDPAIDSAKIDARMEAGVLTLRLPKSEQVKPRKIVVAEA